MLFEYQQGVLEAECEDLAYKLEHADNFKIADLEQAKTAAAKSRLNLLKSTSFKLSVWWLPSFEVVMYLISYLTIYN